MSLKVHTLLSDNYTFDEEPQEVYSDCEYPHQYFSEERFPNQPKNIRQPAERIGYSTPGWSVAQATVPQGVSTGEVSQPQVLSKLAGLVQQQKTTLEAAGVALPTAQAGGTATPGQSTTVPQPGTSTDPQPRTSTGGPTLSTRARQVGALPPKHFPALKKDQKICPVCKKKCGQHSKLVTHYSTAHTYKGDFTCDVCFKSFSSKLILERHRVIHTKFKCFLKGHPATRHGCPPPGQYSTREEFQAHLEQNINYQAVDPELICKYCLLFFTGKNPRASLLRHQKHRCQHNPNVIREYAFCKYCGRRYSEKRYCKQHEKQCTQASGGTRGRGRRGRGRGRGRGQPKGSQP